MPAAVDCQSCCNAETLYLSAGAWGVCRSRRRRTGPDGRRERRSQAARVLAREAGVEAWTLLRFLARHGYLSDPDRLARAREAFGGALLAVDEASMIDTARMEALLRTARALGVARAALVGDTSQLRAVDAGQPFRLLQRAGMETAVMDEVLRQRDPALLERPAVAGGRAGRADGDLRRAGARGPARRARRGSWLALGLAERADTAVMAPTHAIRREVNAAVREGLAVEGALRGPSLVIDRPVPRQACTALRRPCGIPDASLLPPLPSCGAGIAGSVRPLLVRRTRRECAGAVKEGPQGGLRRRPGMPAWKGGQRWRRGRSDRFESFRRPPAEESRETRPRSETPRPRRDVLAPAGAGQASDGSPGRGIR